MNNKHFLAALVATSVANAAMAGGLLSNTNQSIQFLRNPAQDATIGIQGVYHNPAGVAFLGDGFHLNVNLMNAKQTRTSTTYNPLFAMGINNNGATSKEYEGDAKAPVLPALQAAYNKGPWSFQFNFGVTGGGGKCEFAQGTGTFESIVAGVGYQLDALKGIDPNLAVNGYGVDGYMHGRQYYYTFQAGAAYKLNDHWSVYGGLRLTYGDATYKAKLDNIQVSTPAGLVSFMKYAENINSAVGNLQGNIAQLQAAEAQYQAAGLPVPAEISTTLARAQAGMTAVQQYLPQLEALAPYLGGVNLVCDQSGWGIAPIVGVHYQNGKWNLAAKYEFKTRMRLKNSSTLAEASLSQVLERYVDGKKIAEDTPALLTIGGEYSVLDNVRVNAGWHHYFDVDTKQYTKDMLGDTNEYLAGVEWDICDALTVSGGVQRTVYDYKDAGINDMQFNVNATTMGLGLAYKVNDAIKINAGYFHSFYDTYDKTSALESVPGATSQSFTRTNRVIGVGAEFTF